MSDPRVVRAVAIPMPARQQSGPNIGLDNIIYQRVFYPSALDETADGPRAVALTFESNGYLLWVLRKARDGEGDLVWARESVEFLPPGREDAIDRVVALAGEHRARFKRGTAGVAP